MFLYRNNRVKFFTSAPGPWTGLNEHMFDLDLRNKKRGRSTSEPLRNLLTYAFAFLKGLRFLGHLGNLVGRISRAPIPCGKVSDLMALQFYCICGVIYVIAPCHRRLHLTFHIRLSPFLYCIYIIARF